MKISLLPWSFQSISKILLSCLEIIDHIGVTQTYDNKRVNHLKRSEKKVHAKMELCRRVTKGESIV